MNNSFDDFDKQFNKTQKLAFGGIIVGWIIGLGLTGFGIWVVVKLLQHFAVI